ncbi:imidazole glycerol phosphate synthase subunit HisH [Pseudomonas sp. LFM046]|uniref:imidazole glycerol phosphate synthase subunit HisH n=1 Tax=Pseudomonas sp. LFM046 TaxID=1608357 RepID=UPI0005CFE5AE|nr:imidazole glycerol phosphate synthase subunit HisH [Pseudomonas sp. LFM046]
MTSRTISIIDYGAGNIASVVNMIRHVGGEAEVIDSPDQLTSATKLLLPGVGAFDHGMQCLGNGGWPEKLQGAVMERKVPILGICLGMQLMCLSSEEGTQPGLGWIDARVRRFKFDGNERSLKVPHMGWSSVQVEHDDLLVPCDVTERRFYFVHSYYVECADRKDVLLSCTYGKEFVAGFHHENIWGVQFHPEKSHRFGMELFRRFLEV